MGRVWTVYTFKVRQFFGPLRHSAAAIALIVLIAITTLPTVPLVGYFLPDTPIWGSLGLAGLFATGLSAFLVFDLLFALSGGTMTHPSEIEFFATSRLKPREYLAADLLFQFTLTDAIGVPILLLGGAGLAVRTGLWLPVMGAILVFVVLATMGLAIGQAVGLAVSAHRKYAKTVLVLLVIAFLLPAGSMIWPVLPTYADVPLPSSAAAFLIVGLLNGATAACLGPYAFVLGLFALAVGAVWAVQSRTEVFPYLRPTMRVAFGQMDMSRKVAQQEAMTRGLARYTRRFSLDLLKGGALGMMTRLLLTRVVRDGSVLMVGMLTGMLVLIGAANRSTTSTGSSETDIFTTGWAAIIIPLVLAFNWNATERANLWTVAMSSRYLGTYFRGMYRALVVITMCVALVAALAGGTGGAFGVLAILVMALGACGGSVLVMELVKIPTDAFSLRSSIPFIVVPLIAIGAGAPILLLDFLAGTLGILAWPIAVAYTAVIVVLLDSLPARMAPRFQI